LWARHLGIDHVGRDDNFFTLGGESLVGLRLFAEIRRTFNVSLPIDTLFAAPTIARLAEHVHAAGVAELESGEHATARAAANHRPAGLLVDIQPLGDRPPLFCVHDQNGYVLLYRDLARHLGPDQPFVAIQAHGLDDLRMVDRSVEQMARRYVDAVLARRPAGPYWLAGSSLGGIVAYEMAQQLSRAGHEVSVLALLDSWTPADLRRWCFGNDEPVWQRAGRHLRELFVDGPRHYFDARRRNRRSWQEYQAAAAAERERRATLSAELVRHLESGAPLSPEALAFHLEQVYGEAYRAYDAAPYGGRVTLFRASQRANDRDWHPTLGWDAVPLGGLEVVDVPGAHGFIVREPHVAALARQLRALLDRALSETPGIYVGGSERETNSTTVRS
jgi:thioesterase domain-containing protein